MQTTQSYRWSNFKHALRIALIGCLAAPLLTVDASAQQVARQDDLWRRSLTLVREGDFSGAAASIKGLEHGGALTDRVRVWLEEHETMQAERRKHDLEDFEKYTGYARTRIEREEYREALGWVLAAADVAEDRDALVKSEWVQDLVNKALLAAEDYREKAEWRNAWQIYAQLGVLHDREPRFRKLEHEVLTLLRLESLFKEGSKWEEHLERVQWQDAQRALEYTALYYVVPPDFKRITEAGLEQMLLLADAKSAKEAFPGLQNEHDRNDFKARIRARLEQVKAAPSIDRGECIRHFRRVVKDINAETVRLPETIVVSELMNGALDPLDEFTTIIWPSSSDEFDKHTRGDFIGVGISIIKNRLHEIEVVTPLEDTPAYHAGIQAGDIIVSVDGTILKDWSLTKVVDTITGPRDSMVTLTIRRGKDELTFPLKRTLVKIQSIKGWTRDNHESWNFWLDENNGIGYIRINNFQRNTAEDLAQALSKLTAQGLKGLVLDLRWNPGGLLDSAWQVSSMFLSRGDLIVSTKGRIMDEDQELFAPSDGPFRNLPLVVLVDESSASASEIVSGAIRDSGRGIVVGDRTFGKFSVQNLIPLGPSRAKLKITTARYYLPSGASLQREPTSETWGVEPHIPVRLSQKERIRVRLMRRDADLLGPRLKSEDPAADNELPKPFDLGDESEDDPTAKDKPSTDDGEEEKVVTGENAEDGEEKVADADEEKLPPPDEPDENNRPKIDPQVDTALLLLRVSMVAERHPTLAIAEQPTDTKTAKP